MSDAEFENNYWDGTVSKQNTMHSIHQYPAKFPGFIATKSFEFARKRGVQLRTVCDLFCGCGTTAYEAKLEGLNFIGYDIDPVAVLIARAKSNIYDLDSLKLSLKRINERKNKLISSKNFSPREAENPRIVYWFDEKHIHDLSCIKKAIAQSTKAGSPDRDAFLCIFSSILKPCSRWLAKSIKPQIDPNKTPSDASDLFEKHAKRFIHSVENSQKAKGSSETHILRKNILTLKPRRHVDLIVSSPPYATSYEYADLHQLSSLWLGFAKDYKTLRKGCIGSSYSCEERDYSIESLNPTGERIVLSLPKTIAPRKRASLIRYYRDMQKAMRVSYSLLENNGMAIFVIGDTDIKGITIPNSQHLIESMREAGFVNIEKFEREIAGKLLTPYRQKDGKFSHTTSNKNIYKHEFIIVGRRFA